ncbi:MAG: type VI secretion system baseplate subunit TssG, partial [Archangium sp.]|nr:type VI secretion system baseplate subunit TssG [Archangium sp.]
MAVDHRDQATAVGSLDEGMAWANALGFFRFVALMERLTAGAARIGGDGPVADEAIRFRHNPALTFSAGDLSAVEMTFGATTRFEVETTFLGLTGSSTPLPLY